MLLTCSANITLGAFSVKEKLILYVNGYVYEDLKGI